MFLPISKGGHTSLNISSHYRVTMALLSMHAGAAALHLNPHYHFIYGQIKRTYLVLKLAFLGVTLKLYIFGAIVKKILSPSLKIIKVILWAKLPTNLYYLFFTSIVIHL